MNAEIKSKIVQVFILLIYFLSITGLSLLLINVKEPLSNPTQ